MFRRFTPRDLVVYIHHFACGEFFSLEYSLKALDRMVCADIYIFSLIIDLFVFYLSNFLFNSIFLRSFEPVLNVGHQKNTRICC